MYFHGCLKWNLNQFMDALCEKINEEMHLDDIIEYDSMSQLNVVVLIDTEFGILITPEDLDECEKVKDIILLLGDNVI